MNEYIHTYIPNITIRLNVDHSQQRMTSEGGFERVCTSCFSNHYPSSRSICLTTLNHVLSLPSLVFSYHLPNHVHSFPSCIFSSSGVRYKSESKPDQIQSDKHHRATGALGLLMSPRSQSASIIRSCAQYGCTNKSSFALLLSCTTCAR